MVRKLNANQFAGHRYRSSGQYVGHDNPVREAVVKTVYEKYGRPRAERGQFGMYTMEWVTGSAARTSAEHDAGVYLARYQLSAFFAAG